MMRPRTQDSRISCRTHEKRGGAARHGQGTKCALAPIRARAWWRERFGRASSNGHSMRRIIDASGVVLAICVVWMMTSPTIAQVKPAAGADAAVRLPVKRVILYKNGVGYFEHLGLVSGNQT